MAAPYTVRAGMLFDICEAQTLKDVLISLMTDHVDQALRLYDANGDIEVYDGSGEAVYDASRLLDIERDYRHARVIARLAGARALMVWGLGTHGYPAAHLTVWDAQDPDRSADYWMGHGSPSDKVIEFLELDGKL